jgi:hypothetical protein
MSEKSPSQDNVQKSLPAEKRASPAFALADVLPQKSNTIPLQNHYTIWNQMIVTTHARER